MTVTVTISSAVKLTKRLSRQMKYSFTKFNPVCLPQIRSAIVIQPKSISKLKLPRPTNKWSPIILALPLLPRKCCSVTLESNCVLPCNLGVQKNSVFKGILVAQSHRCRNKCLVHSKQSHRRKRNREPSISSFVLSEKEKKTFKNYFKTKGSKVF